MGRRLHLHVGASTAAAFLRAVAGTGHCVYSAGLQWRRRRRGRGANQFPEGFAKDAPATLYQRKATRPASLLDGAINHGRRGARSRVQRR